MARIQLVSASWREVVRMTGFAIGVAVTIVIVVVLVLIGLGGIGKFARSLYDKSWWS